MLTTRCPHCGTSFRVRPEQLRVRAGRVRCGHCQAPFSALESLIEDAAPEASAPEAEAPATATTAAGTDAARDEATQGPAGAPAGQAPAAPTTTEPARPRHEYPAAAYPMWSGQREIAPPIPELEPGARPLGATLDFDLDGEQGDSPSPAPLNAEATELSPDWTWQENGSSASGDAAVERLEDLEESEDPAPHAASRPSAIEPDTEPVFVTAFASPGTHLPLPPDDGRVEPGEHGDPPETDDTVFEAPEEALYRAPEPEAVAPRPLSLRARLDGSNTPAAPVLPPAAAHVSTEWDSEPRPRHWPWAIGVALLATAALLQGLLLERHDIAREWPASRPVLETVCAEIGCVMPWPRAKAQISILAHDLHPQPGSEDRYELVGTLRNSAGFDQEYPHLELTLTDVFNRALARRVLPPEEWVSAEMRRSAAFPAGGDIGFTLTFDATALPISGYKLYAFYP